MEINPDKPTIKSLFNNRKEKFVIPPYQRRFAWTESQYSALFEDVKRLPNDEKHLFGMLLLQSPSLPDQDGISNYFIVDGQQRITTLLILFFALNNVLEDSLVKLSSEKEKKVVSGYSTNFHNYLYCETSTFKEINKIELGSLDNDDYKLLLEKNTSKIKNENILKAYNYFYENLSSFDFQQLRNYISKLEDLTLVIRLNIANPKDSFKLFETINNRGLKLTPTDILKNFILGHASHFDKLLNMVIKQWASIIQNLDGIDTDLFFKQYLSGILGRKIPLSKLVDEFRKYYINVVKDAEYLSDFYIYNPPIKNGDDEDLNDDDIVDENNADISIEQGQMKSKNKKINKINLRLFLEKIELASKIYQQIHLKTFNEKKLNSRIRHLQQILSIPSYIFLLNLLQRSIHLREKLKILNMIETFMLRRHICEARTGELEDIFSELCSYLDQDLEKMVKQKLFKHLPKDEKFKELFITHQFKGKIEERAKYVLEQIEYYTIKSKDEFLMNIGEEVELEHIIPKKIKKTIYKGDSIDWVSYLGEDAIEKHKDYLYLIGNLTLIADELNKSCSNRIYKTKQKNYKKSGIQLNHKIIESYRQFKFKQVILRGTELAETAVKIWSL